MGRLPCQKSERIPLVAARCVTLEAPHRATAGGVFGRTAFILSDKNGVVVVGTLVDCAVCDAVLHDGVVDATPEKVLQHPVAVLIPRRQEQHFRFILFHGRGRRFPVAHVPREGLHGFHEAEFPHFHQIVEGGEAAEAP